MHALKMIANIVKHSKITPKFQQKMHKEMVVGFYITWAAVAAQCKQDWRSGF